MARPLVSAIIPAYNAADTIGAALESVRSQTYQNIEIVVCNDGSTDDTARVVQDWAHPEVLYIEQENSGPSAARNRAAEAASGEFLATLDADDKWLPEKTERQLQVMFDDPGISAVATNGWVHRGEYRYPWANPRAPRLVELSVRELLRSVRPISASLMMRADVFREIGGYDPTIVCGEDLDLFCRLLVSGHRLVYLPELLYLIVATAGSVSAGSSAKHADDILRVLSKLAPGHADAAQASPLSEAEYSWFMADRLMRAAAACTGQGRRERARSYLHRLDELEGLAAVYRLQRWASAISWSLFTIAAGAHRAYLKLCRTYRHWGLVGVLRRGWDTRIVPWLQRCQHRHRRGGGF